MNDTHSGRPSQEVSWDYLDTALTGFLRPTALTDRTRPHHRRNFSGRISVFARTAENKVGLECLRR